MQWGRLAIVAMALAFTVTAAAAQTYPEGMISYWKLDEGIDATAHDSVGTNDGTISGAVWSSGQVEGALDFGDYDYVSVPHAPVLGPEQITIEAWVRPTAGGGYRAMVSKQPYCGFCYPWSVYSMGFLYNTVRPYVEVAVGGVPYAAIADEEIPLGSWTHLAGTYDGETLKLYVDGTLARTETAPSGPIDGSSRPVFLGKPPSNAQSLRGRLDEIAIFDRALSQEEVEQHYLNGLSGWGYEEPEQIPASSATWLVVLMFALVMALLLIIALPRRAGTM